MPLAHPLSMWRRKHSFTAASPAAHAVFDALFLFVSVGLIAHGLSSGHRPPRNLRMPYVVGETASFPGVDFNNSPRTLVVYATKGCCATELSAYAHIATSLRTIFLTSSQPALTLIPDDVNRIGFRDAQIFTIHAGSTKFLDLPTGLLVSNGGRIERVWRGKLSPAALNEVAQVGRNAQDLRR